MTRTTLRRTLSTAALLATATGVLAGTVGTSSADAIDRGRGDGVAQLRKDVRAYEDVEAALAAGFVPGGPCAESPAGGMGVHYVHAGRLQAAPDPRLPQVLLYEPDSDGLRLVGAEFMVADADQDLSTDGDRPWLFDQPFDGPMPGHEPGMPVHYDLHVWTDEANPAGVFAPWNPRVSC